MNSESAAFDELCSYTLSLGDPQFIHQHAVNAFGAQTADEKTKPLPLMFSLAGLYLHIKVKFNGRQVQQAHARFAQQRKQNWPVLMLPKDRCAIRVDAVLTMPPGCERQQAIEDWCAVVWAAFRENHGTVSHWVRERL